MGHADVDGISSALCGVAACGNDWRLPFGRMARGSDPLIVCEASALPAV